MLNLYFNDGNLTKLYSKFSIESGPAMVELAVRNLNSGLWASAHIEYMVFGHIYWDSELGAEQIISNQPYYRIIAGWKDVIGRWHIEPQDVHQKR